MSAPIGTPIHHDDIFIDTANIYRGLCTLMENAGDGIFYGGIDAFCRSVYRLHKEFHKKAHVILMSYGDDDLDIEDYYR